MDQDLRHMALDVIADLQDWLNKAHAAFQQNDQTEGTKHIDNVAHASKELNKVLQRSAGVRQQ